MGKKKQKLELSKGEKSPALFAQPNPKSDRPDVWPLVIKDMEDRDRLGKTKYGIPLRSHNGRDALVDAYQEVLDLSVYLRQEIEERRDLQSAVAAARKVSGYENANPSDIAGLIDFLLDHIETQKGQIEVLSSTLIHYQTQPAFVAGFDMGVEKTTHIFEQITGDDLPPDRIPSLLSEVPSWREDVDAI